MCIENNVFASLEFDNNNNKVIEKDDNMSNDKNRLEYVEDMPEVETIETVKASFDSYSKLHKSLDRDRCGNYSLLYKRLGEIKDEHIRKHLGNYAESLKDSKRVWHKNAKFECNVLDLKEEELITPLIDAINNLVNERNEEMKKNNTKTNNETKNTNKEEKPMEKKVTFVGVVTSPFRFGYRGIAFISRNVWRGIVFASKITYKVTKAVVLSPWYATKLLYKSVSKAVTGTGRFFKNLFKGKEEKAVAAA